MDEEKEWYKKQLILLLFRHFFVQKQPVLGSCWNCFLDGV